MSFSLYGISLLPTGKSNNCLLKRIFLTILIPFDRSDLAFTVISLQTKELFLSFLFVQVSR